MVSRPGTGASHLTSGSLGCEFSDLPSFPRRRAFSSNMADLGKLRREYAESSLDRDKLAAEPIDQFREWFEQALIDFPVSMLCCICGTTQPSPTHGPGTALDISHHGSDGQSFHVILPLRVFQQVVLQLHSSVYVMTPQSFAPERNILGSAPSGTVTFTLTIA